ncbi:MAG: hypothetical protein JO257_36085 [Deltaproteobacteria bacterium]|nr:hypothetical protein [Deltaproteobacteria bacterium]
MKILALACLSFACATAGAEPQPAAPPPVPARRLPPPKGCVARGTPMFEIAHDHEAGAKLGTSSFRIYASGAWQFDSKNADGHDDEPMRGCFAGADLDAIRADVKVDWKTSTAQVHCMAVSPAFTVYKVNGKIVFTQKLCSGVSLDEASEKARADLEARASTVTRATPAPTACEAKGDAKLVLAHKVDGGAKLPTWTYSIYDNGAWTYTASNAVAQNGCFAGADLEAVKKDLDVPWKTTTAKIHCMAYSAAYTEVVVGGKVVYTQRMCNGLSLDAASEAALTDLEGRAPKAQP